MAKEIMIKSNGDISGTHLYIDGVEQIVTDIKFEANVKKNKIELTIKPLIIPPLPEELIKEMEAAEKLVLDPNLKKKIKKLEENSKGKTNIDAVV
jgi:hypothetical protein